MPHTGSRRHIGSPTNWRAPQVRAPGPLFGKVLAFDRTEKKLKTEEQLETEEEQLVVSIYGISGRVTGPVQILS